ETYAKALDSVDSGYVEGCCPGLTDASICPTTCPKDKVCDGSSCVYPRDCPCYRNAIRRTTGAVWKENNGCSNCICMGGEVQCVKETCEVTSCPAGQKLDFAHPDDCCAVCMEDDNSCIDESGQLHNVGDSWTSQVNTCELCSCTMQGVKCEAEPCSEVEKPICSDGQMLVTKESGCCSEYDCVCDKAMCTSTMPICDEHFSAVIVNPTDCCPIYECVCRSETCPVSPSCAFDERRERVNSDTECCGEYKCERIGCVDESGNFHEVDTTWSMTSDACQQCSCLGDRNIMCKARECADIAKPTCPGGIEPSVVFDIDGCCASYVCDFVCRGYAGSSRIHTFDGFSYARSCPCSHVLAKDSFGANFEVSVKRGYCSGSICTKSLIITDKLSNEIYELSADSKVPETTSSSFVIEIVGKVQTVTAKSSGVKVVFDQASDTWSIHVPAKFSGQTEGLCGLADSEISNDLWMGSYAVASVSSTATANSEDIGAFFNHWLATDSDVGISAGVNGEAVTSACLSDALPETGLIAGGGSSLVRSYCDQLFASSVFSPLASVVDPSEYVDTCVRAIAGLPVMKIGVAVSADWPGCSVFAAYASAAARVGKCIEWRNNDFCPYSGCGAGNVYMGCGTSIVKTCDNFKTFNGLSVTYDTEGCFCTGGKVLLDGECIEASDCPVCSDESGYGRKAGDQWYNAGEPCIVATCQPDSSVVQSQMSCPPAPLCSPNEVLAKLSDDSVCCTAYVCLPDNHESKCAGLRCPPIVRPRCAVGEQWKATPSGPLSCCLTYTCECSSDSCPTTPVPSCEEGEELEVVGTDDCCPSATCICKPDTCAPTPECFEAGYVLKVVEEGRCCVTYECMCDRDTCVATEVPSCLGGETAVVANPGECCPVYACQCDKSQCKPCIEECAAGFTRVLVSEPGACCDEYDCKCDVTQCPIAKITPCSSLAGYRLISSAKEIRAPGLPECCASEFEEICICDVASCPISTVKCASYERKYQTNPGECCPTYACECDNTQCERGEMSCSSKQHLVEKVINSCCSVTVCECDVCEPAQLCKEGWTESDTFDQCGCTIRECVPPTECVHLGETHEPGLTWMEDVCTECSCSTSPNSLGEYETTCSMIKCGTCSSGYTYVPVAGQCCGDCVQTVCHHEGKQFAPGQTWIVPDDQCTTCECMIDPISNEVYSQCSAPACAPIDPLCAPEDILSTEDGCCTYCRTRNLPETKCRPVSDFFEEMEHGGCKSAEKVNVTMCEGQCTSASVFSSEAGVFQKQCSCCSTIKTEKRTVDLVCPDLSTKVYVYEVALECACHATACGSEPVL
uniref:von Willebrand factor n=1 Tax=Ciona savignyi TaxID=51511 RepID=H2Y887_CIOSA